MADGCSYVPPVVPELLATAGWGASVGRSFRTLQNPFDNCWELCGLLLKAILSLCVWTWIWKWSEHVCVVTLLRGCIQLLVDYPPFSFGGLTVLVDEACLRRYGKLGRSESGGKYRVVGMDSRCLAG